MRQSAPFLTTLVPVISIHALRKECDIGGKWLEEHGEISIHALRKECDQKGDDIIDNFSSISIHALRKECDISALPFRAVYLV